MLDTENKQAWCSWGADQEPLAIERANRGGLPLIVNPERGESKFAIDAAVLCDIKTRRTPFRRSWDLYRIPPGSCVTLNVDDVQRYPPYTLILFDVHYEDLGTHGQWVMFARSARNAPIHRYERRADDQVNKQCAYVLNLEKMRRIE